jgi:hypothetical protein
MRYKEVSMTIINKHISNLAVSSFIFSDHTMLIESKHALQGAACTTSFYISLTHRYQKSPK